jgi:hypothetical protein
MDWGMVGSMGENLYRGRGAHGPDVRAGLKILCSDCGAMNFVAINSSTCSYTLYCKACGAELRLFIRRSRPASFAPPSAISSTGAEASRRNGARRIEEAIAIAA